MGLPHQRACRCISSVACVLLLLIGTFIFVCPIPIYFARQRPGLRVRLAKLAVGLWIGIAAIIILWVGYVFWPESIFMQDTDCRTPEECAVPPRAYMVWFGITSLSGSHPVEPGTHLSFLWTPD